MCVGARPGPQDAGNDGGDGLERLAVCWRAAVAVAVAVVVAVAVLLSLLLLLLLRRRTRASECSTGNRSAGRTEENESSDDSAGARQWPRVYIRAFIKIITARVVRPCGGRTRPRRRAGFFVVRDGSYFNGGLCRIGRETGARKGKTFPKNVLSDLRAATALR